MQPFSVYLFVDKRHKILSVLDEVPIIFRHLRKEYCGIISRKALRNTMQSSKSMIL